MWSWRTATIAAAAALLAVALAACGTADGHDEGAEESHSESGEESGIQYTLDETYDETRDGARLILNYDAASNSFVGTVENTTSDVLTSVRVEVHLSNGVELGPTTPTDLTPGELIDVALHATDQLFQTFGAHPEVGGSGEGSNEHGGESGEGGGEHGDG